MSDQGVQSPGIGEVVSFRPGLAWARKPSVLVPLFVAAAIAGAAVPWLLSYTPYGQQAIDQQIDREDGALCAKFGFARGANPHSDCKAALVDLRRRHERYCCCISGGYRPPVTSIVSPVTKSASDEARKQITFAWSAASAIRRSGVRSISAA